MRCRFLIALLGTFGVHQELLAQADLYDIGSVREMRLYFDAPNWADLLDTLYLADDDDRLIGDLVIDGTLIPDVGVRYKGFSSYSSNRVKNPFNIKLNEIHAGQRYHDVDKIKLSNVIQDPSFIRETLSYEIAGKYMPSSLANYANVYVNDVLIGLYTNVEAVNKEFVDKHFGSRSNTFFKGNPDMVNLNGENSNLSDSPGSDPTNYYSLYQLESDQGWDELLQLIDTLNNTPQNIESVLNVDRTLWMHAFNYAVINFDSYVGYAQNYYVYKDDNDRWNPILWDLNMSFGSFRLSDASLFWNGFSIAQAITMDPLMHHINPSVQPRPLMRNLFLDPTYRKMYLAHLRTIIQENFANQEYATRAANMQNLIASHVMADTNKFYSDQDFFDNLGQTVNDLVDYPGITELMDQRTTYLSNYTGFSGEPAIATIEHFPQMMIVGDDVSIIASIADADSAFLAYRSKEGDLFEYVEMLDNGLHNDGVASDGVYGATVNARTNLLQFYVYAENDSAGMFSPARAAYEFHEILVPIGPEDIVINEFMAVNEGHVLDGDGDADDWIELYNPGIHSLSTKGLFLSDDQENLTKWEMPTREMDPGEYMIIWADEQSEQGARHANFKLDASGEMITMAYADSTIIDQVMFQTQYPISTTGRFPNGTGPFQEMFSTFNAQNSINDNEELDRYMLIYPNPSNGDVFALIRENEPFELQIFAMDGRAITPSVQRNTNELVSINTATFAPAVYVLQVRTENNTTQQPFIITE